VPGAQLPAEFKQFARGDRTLDIINGVELDAQWHHQAARVAARVFRPIRPSGCAHNYRTSVTVARRRFARLWHTGAGVGVAVIDSGNTVWHDDLTVVQLRSYPYGNQRVSLRRLRQPAA
jgi:hypothetical protein